MRKNFKYPELGKILAPAPRWNDLKIIQTLIKKTENIQR